MATVKAATKSDVYESITNKIIAIMERGELPWTMPWVSNTPSRPLRSCGKTYSGINVLVLWVAAIENSFSSPYWFTFNQAKELGSSVRKGAKGTQVVFAATFSKEVESDEGEKETRDIPFMKAYYVFNADQIDGLPTKYQGTPIEVNKDEAIEHADKFFANLESSVKYSGSQAYYRKDDDSITLPKFEAFNSSVDFYSTIAHEHIHWTRHSSRLNRDFSQKKFGDSGYALEELVAELGSAYLMADLGLEFEPREDHAAYVASWLKALKNDKRFIFTAASHASRAVEFMHSKQGVQS